MQRHANMVLDERVLTKMAALYQQYAPAIFAYLLRHMSSREDAEDILVEVFLAALENETFLMLPEKAQLVWLWRVTRNKMIDTYRRSLRRQSITLEHIADSVGNDDMSDPEQLALRQEQYRDLQIHLKNLSTLQQEVLRLRFGQGMRCSEIAARMGKREGAIKAMLSRTLNLLKNIYKAE
ncbi:MAG TPA: sigma-70 family RNA polymerase sigma factor [Ktedonobacteraceae bacterium]